MNSRCIGCTYGLGSPRSYLNKVSKLLDEYPQLLIQADPAGHNLDMDEMEGQDQTMQKGEIEGALKQRSHRGMLIETLLIRPPLLQCATRDLKHLGRLTLSDAEMIAFYSRHLSFDTLPLPIYGVEMRRGTLSGVLGISWR